MLAGIFLLVRCSILLCHNKIALSLTIADRSLSSFAGKSAGAYGFEDNDAGAGRVFRYSRNSWAGHFRFLAGYNHSVIEPDIRCSV